MGTGKNKEAAGVTAQSQLMEPLQSVLVGDTARATLDHEAGLVRELLVQRYREFGTELFEERANELVDCVRRIFARLAAPLEETKEQATLIDVTTLSDSEPVLKEVG